MEERVSTLTGLLASSFLCEDSMPDGLRGGMGGATTLVMLFFVL